MAEDEQGGQEISESGTRSSTPPPAQPNAPEPIVMNATPPEKLLKREDTIAEGTRSEEPPLPPPESP
jgi:hypothetical protein